MSDGYYWAARRCLCEDDVNGRECYCYENGARCSCEECQASGEAGRAERMADTDYDEPEIYGGWL